MMNGDEIASNGMTVRPSFMQVYAGVQAILRFSHSKMKGCKVGTTQGKVLCSMQLK
jgi:hypothetical protein